jgi:putative molybdopterin biosynthesis protein
MRLKAAPPTAAPARARAPATGSELRGLSPERAVGAWLQACGRAGRPARLPTARVPLAEGLGRVTAEPVWALRSSPAFAAAAMDGIAVRAADTAGAQPGRPVLLGAETFDVIDTGNPLPVDRDAVVMREHVHLDHGVASIEAATTPGRHVRPVGEDIAAGELLLAPGHRLRPVDLAAAAAAGVTELTVRRAPIVAILPTGDELRPADANLAHGQLADTNSLMLDGQARDAGCETRRWPILPDDPDLLTAALRAAAAEADLVVLVAGTSAGRHDYAPDVLRRSGRIVVQGVAMRPGHPAVLAIVDDTPVMACPGYPVSAALAFELVLALLASLEGAAPGRRPAVDAHLAAGVRLKRGSRHRVRVRIGTVAGRRVAIPLRGGASVLTSLAHADALLAIAPEHDALPAGAVVQAELLRPAADLDAALLIAGVPDRALDLLALAVANADSGRGTARVAFCQMAPDEAVELVRDGLCHAAVVAGGAGSRPIDDDGCGRLVAVRLAECDVVLAVAADELHPSTPNDPLRPGLRVVVGPHGTLARPLLEEAACEIAEVRSDAAAVAAVAAGHADCAAIALPAARIAGLATMSLGRSAVDLVIRRGAAGDGDEAVSAVLEVLRSEWLARALEADGYDVVARGVPVG